MEYVTCKFNRHDEIFLYWGEKEKKEREPTHSRVFFSSSLCTHSSQLCSTLCEPRTVACQAPLSLGFSRHEYRSGLPFPPGDLPHPGVEPISCIGRQILYHWATREAPQKIGEECKPSKDKTLGGGINKYLWETLKALTIKEKTLLNLSSLK